MASWPSPSDRAVLGKPVKRLDGPDKVKVRLELPVRPPRDVLRRPSIVLFAALCPA